MIYHLTKTNTKDWFGKKRNLFVIAPHPDDETVGAAILMHRAKALGIRTEVVFLTTGVAAKDSITMDIISLYGSYENYCKVRQQETNTAMKLLNPDKVVYLGYHSRELVLRMRNILQFLRRLIPNELSVMVLLPAYEGAHPDHDVTNCVISKLAQQSHFSCWEYLGYHLRDGVAEHQRFKPQDKYDEYYLNCSTEEIKFKESVLKEYKSQKEMILKYFQYNIEGFRNMPCYDYSRMPSPPLAYYEQWGAEIPSTEICKSCITFLKSYNKEL